MTALPKSVEDAIWDAGSGSTPTEEEAKVTEALRAAIAAAIREAENEAIERAATRLDERAAAFDGGLDGALRRRMLKGAAAEVRSLKHSAPSPGEGGRR
jgi:hypothetical protein